MCPTDERKRAAGTESYGRDVRERMEPEFWEERWRRFEFGVYEYGRR